MDWKIFFPQETDPEITERFKIVLDWFFKLPPLVTQELKDLRVFPKGSTDIATNVDHAVNESFIKCLLASFPDDYIITEECSPLGKNIHYLHILDPIDLTRNLGRSEPFFTLYCFRLHQRPQFSIIQHFNPSKLFVATQQGLFISDGISWENFSPKTQNQSDRWVKIEDYFITESSISYNAPSSRGVFFDLALGNLDWFEYSKRGDWVAWDYAPLIDMIQLLPYTHINVCPEVKKNGYLLSPQAPETNKLVLKASLMNEKLYGAL